MEVLEKDGNLSIEAIEVFSDPDNVYYAHGTGRTGVKNNQLAKSIFENGLRCSHEQLYYTTVCLGLGSNKLLAENIQSFDNWQHLDSKQIIIASIPLKYQIIERTESPLYGKREKPYCKYISNEEAQANNISSGYYLKPEFILGKYDSENKQFISNENYYKNLSKEEQESLFLHTKEKYIEIIKDSGISFSEYSKTLAMTGRKDPLSNEEITQLDKETCLHKKESEEKHSASNQILAHYKNINTYTFDKSSSSSIDPSLGEDIWN